MRPLQRTAILGLVICRPDGRRRSVSLNDLHHAFGERGRKVATKLGQCVKPSDRNRPGADLPGDGNILRNLAVGVRRIGQHKHPTPMPQQVKRCVPRAVVQ